MSAAAPTYGNSVSTYGTVAKGFHWLTALLILTLFPLGLVANDWPYDTPDELAMKGTLFSIHKTLGVTVFFVALLRILWALTQPKPGLLHPDRRLESWLAETVHWLLYVSIVAVPLAGWISHAAATGFAPIWWPFGQDLPFVPKNDWLAEAFGGVHEIFTKVLLVALLLHVAGALKHHFLDRDQTLARMLPGRVVLRLPVQDRDRTPVLVAFGLYGAALALGILTAPEASRPELAVPDLAAPNLAAPDVAEPAPDVPAQQSGWAVQQGTLGISVLQFGSAVKGGFGVWTASIAFDPEAPGPEMGKVTVEIAIASLTLGTTTAEALKPPFLDATGHPVARFAAVIRKAEGAGAYVADGTLTLKGVEQPLALPFTLSIDGDTATMQGSTAVDRTSFGIGIPVDGQALPVSPEVTVDVALTATRTQ